MTDLIYSLLFLLNMY